MPQYQVTFLADDGTLYYLRGTIWTDLKSRASFFGSVGLAKAALNSRFIAARVKREARILSIPSTTENPKNAIHPV
jgi:hypothetical protein